MRYYIYIEKSISNNPGIIDQIKREILLNWNPLRKDKRFNIQQIEYDQESYLIKASSRNAKGKNNYVFKSISYL